MHNELASYINSQVTDANAVSHIAEVGDSSISVSSSKIYEVCKALKDGEYGTTFFK